MAARLLKQHRAVGWAGWAAGAVLTVLAGQLGLLRLGDGLARLSYDLPFNYSSRRVPEELVMVYLDPKIKARLGQPADEPLDRSFYTRLLERLSRDGARLVLFDILFDAPHPDGAVDARFAEAMRRQGRVVLVGDLVTQWQGSIVTASPLPPVSPLLEAAAGWGLATVATDPDFAVRKLNRGSAELPSAGWVAASRLNAPVTKLPGAKPAEWWLNYYCEPTALQAANLDHVLETDGPPADFFRDKIVVVGSRPGEGSVAGAERDAFQTPYGRANEPMAAGAVIHAFTLLNLLRGDWLTRLGFLPESALIWIWGMLATAGLMRFRPWTAVGVAIVSAVLIGLLATYLQVRHRIWFSWCVPAAIQTSVALVWSVGFQYLIEGWRREKLRRAFALYYSPYMADRIAESDFDLSLGGQEVEATVMFTDLDGFTAMSERLPPAEVSKLLTTYFTETTRAIFEQDGMIIKYMGDSVMAVWGAPLQEPRPAERAVLAALGMRQAGLREFRGRRLRTRIGINSGKVLAGNLGSEFRFDYTLIGEATNFASRLEGLNKYLGTDILISEATRSQLSDAVQTRRVGRFIVAGKTQPATIYEVLGPAAEYRPAPLWLATFDQALEQFIRREWSECERLLREVLALRGGNDGPAKFYLQEMARMRARPEPDTSWDGVVVFDTK